MTSGITYQKGAWVLHMLRERIGHDNFRKGIQAYYQKYMNANVTTDDFIAEMEKVSKENLKPFFNQWLNRPDILKITLAWEYDAKAKQIIINLNQSQSSGFIFDTPVEFRVYEDGIKKPLRLKFNIDKKTAQFKAACSQKPVLILADPRTVLLADIDLMKNR